MPTPPDQWISTPISRRSALAAGPIALAGLAAQRALAADSVPVRVSMASFTVIYAPYLIAMEKGYYADEGLDIKVTTASGGIATPAQIAGSIDVNTSGPIALSPILRGAALKIVYTEATHSVYQLWSTAHEIKSLRDLKGKQVGINTRGDTLEISTKLALLKAGLPLDWVNYTALGTGNTLGPAFAARSLPAVVLANSDVAELRKRGYLTQGELVVDMMRDLPMPYSGVAVSDAFIKDHSDVLIRYLRATMKGSRYMRKFKPQTLAIVSKYFQYSDPSMAVQDYDQTIPILTKDGTVPNDVLQRDMEVRAAILEIKKEEIPPLQRAYDYSFVRQVNGELDRAHWNPQP
jgi:NitT/TauT family transport system substrate-binding protein